MKKLDVPQSGSQANTTASRNRFGQYNRTRAMPVNPNSTRQSLARSRLSELSVAWRGLSDAERAAWNEYGASHPRVDSLGQTVYPTGHQSFVGINAALVNAGMAQVTEPPVDVDVAAPEIVVTAEEPSTLSVAFTPTPGVNGGRLVVEASPPVSAGRTFNGDWRFIIGGAGNTASPLAAGVAYAAKFGDLQEGLRVFVRARFVQPTGQTSAWNSVSAVVAAP